MPLVKGLKERYEKYTVKTPPDVTGARYAGSKSIAVKRELAGAGPIAEIIELTRNILESKGVPAGQHGVYYAFVEKVRKAMFSHTGATLKAYVDGLKAAFAQKGCDPAILDTLSKLLVGA
jgi:hypothetical protein